MSIIVRDSGDIYFDGTNNVSVMSIFVDSAADLSGLVQYEDIYFQLGSDALDVSTGNKYRMLSNGTWVLQPDNMWQNVYTKTEVDNIVTRIDDDIANVENDVSDLQPQQTKNTNALINLMSVSGKNHLKITASGRTHNGITFTVNADGTVTANGTATANAYIQVAAVPGDSKLFDGSYRLCGCPTGGSRQTYAQYMALSSYARYDYGESVSLIPTGLTGNVGLVIMIYAGYTADNVVFKPMICKAVDYLVSPEYAEYCPTLPELYKMVKSYHP